MSSGLTIISKFDSEVAVLEGDRRKSRAIYDSIQPVELGVLWAGEAITFSFSFPPCSSMPVHHLSGDWREGHLTERIKVSGFWLLLVC